jgi:Tol biopolymer transport system component
MTFMFLPNGALKSTSLSTQARRKFRRATRTGSATVSALAERFRYPGGLALVLVLALIGIGGPPAALAGSTGRIAFIGTDHYVHTCSGDCDHPQCITCPSHGIHVELSPKSSPVRLVQEVAPEPAPGPIRYGWPTFSPDGNKLAFAWAGRRADGNLFGVSVYEFDTAQTLDLFASRSQKIVYISWTPDGKNLSFLAGEPQGLSLMLAEVREHAPVRIVMSGAPLFYDWSRNAERLVVHTQTGDPSAGDSIQVLRLTPTNQVVERVLTRGRVPFRTPCWSADGRHLAYIANFAAETYVVVADPDGTHPRSLASLPVGQSSFVWSPDSRHIAFSTAVIGSEGLYHGIDLLDLKSGDTKQLTRDDVLAYFFSPDGRYLAYIAVPENRPYYTWKTIELKDARVRTLDNFISTEPEALAYRYFDQLAVSHTIWSPDSKGFVYAGVKLFGSPRHALRLTPAPQLWIVPVGGGGSRPVAPATLAFYAPAPRAR